MMTEPQKQLISLTDAAAEHVRTLMGSAEKRPFEEEVDMAARGCLSIRWRPCS